MEIKIFTDGASRGNPGPGGWGAIVVSEDKVKELGGGSKETTNNRMELTAVIEAIETVAKDGSATVFTDSSYVLKGATAWLSGWKKNGWKTKSKEEVLNKDLWERMDKVLFGKKIKWELVKGHSGIPANERCDVIATSFADGERLVLYHGSLAGYQVDVSSISPGVVRAKKKNGVKGKAYSYVSSLGGVVKTHKTWGECEARVKGKSNARFKKAFSKEEEMELISLWKKDSRS